jgi:DNA-binding response OmpR family regulator
MRSRVLLVDPAPETVRLLTPALEHAGHAVEVVRTAAQARVALAAPIPPDAVVLDCHLPQHETLAACRDLKGRSGAPVLVLSGDFSVIHFKATLAAGASLVMAKPVAPEKVAAALQWLLAERGLRMAG